MDQRLYAEYAELQDRHWWFVGRRRILSAVLEAGLGRRDDRTRILDIGCGTGTMLDALGRFGEVDGVDTEPAAVEFCHRHGHPRVELYSGGRLPHPDGSFDLVTMLDVIEHVDDDQTMLGEARRVLRPGGIALTTVPAYRWMWGEQDEVAHHKRRYTRPELRDSLDRAGFDVSRAGYFNTLMFPPIAAIRGARRLRPGPPAMRSDFNLTRPGRLNSVLARVFAGESRIVARRDLPFGVSILALAVRRDSVPG